MAQKQTAGARFEPIDSKVGIEKPSPAVEEAVAKAEASAKKEKFPAGLKDAIALLAQINAEPVSNRDEWLAKQPRLRALKQHVHKLQQGLPVLETTGNDSAYSAESRAGLVRTKLEMLARTNPDVKSLLDERDRLAKQVAEFSKSKSNTK